MEIVVFVYWSMGDVFGEFVYVVDLVNSEEIFDDFFLVFGCIFVFFYFVVVVECGFGSEFRF